MARRKEPIIITSAVGSPLRSRSCEECGQQIIASAKEGFCPQCGSPLPDVKHATEVSLQANVVNSLEASLVCATCSNVLHTTKDVDRAQMAATMYCPVCGSAEVETAEEVPVDDQTTGDDQDKSGKDEKNAPPPDPATPAGAGDPPPPAEGKEADDKGKGDDKEVTDKVEKDVKDKLDGADVSQVEACLLASPEPTWVLFHKGEPLLRIRRSTQPVESHTLFETEQFYNVFAGRAKETSLYAAAREFNAELLKPEKVMANSDIEDTVYERVQSSVLPKLTECVQMAIEGMVRNFYPELNQEMKASMVAELLARGIQDAPSVVEATFDATGSRVFAAVFAKAMELYHKPDNIREELKAHMMATDKVKTTAAGQVPIVEADELESIEVAARLRQGNFPLGGGEPIAGLSASTAGVMNDAVVSSMRGKLNLGGRRG